MFLYSDNLVVVTPIYKNWISSDSLSREKFKYFASSYRNVSYGINYKERSRILWVALGLAVGCTGVSCRLHWGLMLGLDKGSG